MNKALRDIIDFLKSRRQERAEEMTIQKAEQEEAEQRLKIVTTHDIDPMTGKPYLDYEKRQKKLKKIREKAEKESKPFAVSKVGLRELYRDDD